MTEKLQWDSSASFIFAMIGAAVDLGTFGDLAMFYIQMVEVLSSSLISVP